MTYLTNKKADLTAAEIATRLGTDNRTVVATPDPGTPGNVIVASAVVGEDTDTFGVGPDAENITNAANGFDEGPPAVAAYDSAAEADAQVAEIYVEGTLSKEFFRTQYFHIKGTYDASKVAFGAKRCFVNAQGQPLDANGDPTDVASAIDAETTDLTAQGEAVHNWAQVNKTGVGRTAIPGVYDVEARQTALYAPYVGWTAQMTARAY